MLPAAAAAVNPLQIFRTNVRLELGTVKSEKYPIIYIYNTAKKSTSMICYDVCMYVCYVLTFQRGHVHGADHGLTVQRTQLLEAANGGCCLWSNIRDTL